jgi:outer membrane protein TolC
VKNSMNRRGAFLRPPRGGKLLAGLFLFLIALFPPPEAQVPQAISFADAARLALAASEELKHEYAQRGIRERTWVLGRRVYFPRLSLSASEDDRLSQTGGDSFLKNYSLNIDQLIWDGGRTALERNIEKAELNLLGSALERMAGEVAEAAIAAYREVLSTRALIAIREAAWESLKEQRRILSQEAELGLALVMDLAEADIAVAEARIELISLRMDLEEGERQFTETLGLKALPGLSEKVDILRQPVLPSSERARSLAESRNPDLTAARFSIAQKQAELKYSSLWWVPTIRLTGGFGLSGSRYPLSRHNWSVGLSVDFSSPYFSGNINGSAGWEPPYDRTARLQNTLTPLPEPASAMSVHSAELALALEKTKYAAAFEQLGRMAEKAVEKCLLINQKRGFAVESLELAGERLRLAELRLNLGQFTRIELMEVRLEYTRREIAAVEAAVSLLEAERELERLLDLRPGELPGFSRMPDKKANEGPVIFKIGA